MRVIISNGRSAVVQLEREETVSPEQIFQRLFPAGTVVEYEILEGGVRLLFFWRVQGQGLRFADFDSLADLLTVQACEGELFLYEDRLCFIGAVPPAGEEYGALLTAAECAHVREWGRSLGRAEELRAALVSNDGGKPAAESRNLNRLP